MSNNDIFTDSGPELQPLIGPLFTFFPNQYFVHYSCSCSLFASFVAIV